MNNLHPMDRWQLREDDETAGNGRRGSEYELSDSGLREVFDRWIEIFAHGFSQLEGALFLCDIEGNVDQSHALIDVTSDPRWGQFIEHHVKFNLPEDKENRADFKIQASADSMPMFEAFVQSFVCQAAPFYISSAGKEGYLILTHQSIELTNERFFLLEMMALAFASYADSLTLKQNHPQTSNKRKDDLFDTAQKLHSMIEVDAVLTEIMNSIGEVFPNARIELYLSQDDNSTKLPVKSLQFHPLDQDICTQAFVEGQLIVETEETATGRKKIKEIAAPLAGKQGVYGIVRLYMSDEDPNTDDLKYISLLTETAGVAFENAKLYQQSNTLISELRLINEITRRLNKSLKLDEIFNYACNELLNIFKADHCCILQFDKTTNQFITRASNVPSIFNEFFAMDYGFSGKILATKEPLIISDYLHQPSPPSILMEETNSRSLMAAPILFNAELIGVILVTHRLPNYFSYENFKLLYVLSGQIGLAMSNATLHAEVRRMVITDHLTGLHARHYLDEQVSLRQKRDFCGSLIMIDVDDFKKINDTYGHQIGDKVLIQISRTIMSSIRDSDIAARWGGEEIAIYLPQVAKDFAVKVADRIRLRIAEECEPNTTISCGVSDWSWEDEKISVENLFYNADMALYEAKKSGKNSVIVQSNEARDLFHSEYDEF